MDRVFLDANVLFSAAYQERNGLLKLWDLAKKNSNIVLVTSAYAHAEAERNVVSDKHATRLKRLMATVEIINTASSQSLPQDIEIHDNDKPILLAALGANATYLLTGDFKHFGQYYGKAIAGITILPPAEFLKKYVK